MKAVTAISAAQYCVSTFDVRKFDVLSHPMFQTQDMLLKIATSCARLLGKPCSVIQCTRPTKAPPSCRMNASESVWQLNIGTQCAQHSEWKAVTITCCTISIQLQSHASKYNMESQAKFMDLRQVCQTTSYHPCIQDGNVFGQVCLFALQLLNALTYSEWAEV